MSPTPPHHQTRAEKWTETAGAQQRVLVVCRQRGRLGYARVSTRPATAVGYRCRLTVNRRRFTANRPQLCAKPPPPKKTQSVVGTGGGGGAFQRTAPACVAGPENPRTLVPEHHLPHTLIPRLVHPIHIRSRTTLSTTSHCGGGHGALLQPPYPPLPPPPHTRRCSLATGHGAGGGGGCRWIPRTRVPSPCPRPTPSIAGGCVRRPERGVGDDRLRPGKYPYPEYPGIQQATKNGENGGNEEK